MYNNLKFQTIIGHRAQNFVTGQEICISYTKFGDVHKMTEDIIM